jgi:hypothetical protein
MAAIPPSRRKQLKKKYNCPLADYLERFKEYGSQAEGRRNNGVYLALIPAFSPLENEKRSLRLGIHPRLDWWMRTQQPDDSKG